MKNPPLVEFSVKRRFKRAFIPRLEIASAKTPLAQEMAECVKRLDKEFKKAKNPQARKDAYLALKGVYESAREKVIAQAAANLLEECISQKLSGQQAVFKKSDDELQALCNTFEDALRKSTAEKPVLPETKEPNVLNEVVKFHWERAMVAVHPLNKSIHALEKAFEKNIPMSENKPFFLIRAYKWFKGLFHPKLDPAKELLVKAGLEERPWHHKVLPAVWSALSWSFSVGLTIGALWSIWHFEEVIRKIMQVLSW